MYSIIFLCDELLKFIKSQGFMDSTIYRYEIGLNLFKKFCKERNVEFYDKGIGEEFAKDIFLPETNKKSEYRRLFRSKVIRHFNYYLEHQCFILEYPNRKRFDDETIDYLDKDYRDFKEFILNHYENSNTRKFYLYEVYVFLSYLSKRGITLLESVNVNNVYDYFKIVKENRQKAALCVVKYYLNHINRNDLYETITGIRAVRKRKLIPYLNADETNKIWDVLNGNDITYKEKSVFLLGFTLGIRACDIVNLKLEDIHWDYDYISFVQQKTGNAVNLPLSPVLGNSLFNYITKERKQSSYNNVFISMHPPFKPLRDHSSCYAIVNKIITKAGINMDDRFCGIHFLRHNVASNMVNSNVPLEVIAAVLGHSSPDSTNIYITTNKNKLEDCVLSFELLRGRNNG